MIAFALVSDDEAQPLHVEVTTRPRGRQLLVQLYYTLHVHVYMCTIYSADFFLFSVKVDHLDLYIKIKKNNSCRIKTSKILRNTKKVIVSASRNLCLLFN